jgi:hypothetical protein
MLVTETTIKNAVAGIVPRTEGVQVGWEIRLGLDSTNPVEALPPAYRPRRIDPPEALQCSSADPLAHELATLVVVDLPAARQRLRATPPSPRG